MNAAPLTIFLAGAAPVLIGYIWYHPKVFGTQWMRMSHISPEHVEKGKKRMPLMVVLGFFAAVLIAWAMNRIGGMLEIYDAVGAITELAFFVWIGFVAPVLLGSFLWDQRPFKLFLINSGYWFVALSAMAVILIH